MSTTTSGCSLGKGVVTYNKISKFELPILYPTIPEKYYWFAQLEVSRFSRSSRGRNDSVSSRVEEKTVLLQLVERVIATHASFSSLLSGLLQPMRAKRAAKSPHARFIKKYNLYFQTDKGLSCFICTFVKTDENLHLVL